MKKRTRWQLNLAAGWKAASEYLRKSFNQSGGKIVSRLDWELPQIHN